MFSKGSKSLDPIVLDINEADIAAHYFSIKSIPTLIHSPLRKDVKPSLGLYIRNNKVYYKDFSTNDNGTLWGLLMKLWNLNYYNTRLKGQNDIIKHYNIKVGNKLYTNLHKCKITSSITLKCKTREWEDYDIKYWNDYGIDIKWLKYANVYPISHKIIVKDNVSYVYKADKYAYAYVEFKDGKTTLKIYQPLNKNGYKWCNSHDKSVISLWTKVPKKGNILCICSSLKDALCLWANTGIPAVAVQGEGYGISDTAIKVLKSRFKNIVICLDNDEPGLKDAIKLSKSTGFTNIILPQFNGGKDISDLRKIKGKKEFVEIIKGLFNQYIS